MKIFYLILLLINCDPANLKLSYRKPPEKPSWMKQKLGEFIDQVTDLFQYENQIYLKRFKAFIAELKSDPQTQENLILVKNELLKFSLEIQETNFLEKLSQDSNAAQALLKIRDNLYGPDGKLFKEILLEAAHDPEKRKAFLAGQALSDCLKQYPQKTDWYNKCLEPYPFHAKTLIEKSGYAVKLHQFGESELKKNLDHFAEITGQEGHLNTQELTWAGMKLMVLLDYKSLAWLHEFIQKIDAPTLRQRLLFFVNALKNSENPELRKFLSKFGPQLYELAEDTFKAYTKKSFQDFNAQDLNLLLQKICQILGIAPSELPPVFESYQKPRESKDLVGDFREKVSKKIHAKHVHMFNNFIQELSNKPMALEQIIDVKNILLNSPIGSNFSTILEKIIMTDNAIDLLFKIKQDLYGPDGKLLKNILLGAANDPEQKEAFERAQAYARCRKEYYFFECNPGRLVFEWLRSSEKIRFNRTPLKAHLDEFSEMMGLDNQLDLSALTWAAIKLLPITEYESLDPLHGDLGTMRKKKFQEWLVFLNDSLKELKTSRIHALFSGTPEQLKLAQDLFKSFTGQSIQEFNASELRQLLEKLSVFLTNEEYGVLWFIGKG